VDVVAACGEHRERSSVGGPLRRPPTRTVGYAVRDIDEWLAGLQLDPDITGLVYQVFPLKVFKGLFGAQPSDGELASIAGESDRAAVKLADAFQFEQVLNFKGSLFGRRCLCRGERPAWGNQG